jgi:hypothetical protein
MRLIKATTESEEGIFNNTFNTSIRINPKSKICLSSLTSDEARQQLDIDDSNNTIIVQLTSGEGPKGITLENNVYGDLKFSLFFEDFTKKLNGSVFSVGKGIGYEYKVSLDNNNRRLNILGKQFPYKSQPTLWKLNNTEETNGIFNSNLDIATDTNTTNINLNLPWCNGGALFSCRIHTLFDETDPNKCGFIMGLSKLLPSLNPNYNTGSIEHGIEVRTLDGNYSFYNKGIYSETNVPIGNIQTGSSQNDLLVISLNADYYEYTVYNEDNPDGILLHEPNLFKRDNYIDVYPFIAFQGSKGNTRVFNVGYTASPFYTSNKINLDGDDINQTSLSTDPNQSQGATQQFIQFESIELANFLGFTYQKNPISNPVPNVKELNLISDEFGLTTFTDSFTLELLNLSIDSYSYDGEIGERRNILAVVPQQFNTLNQIIYQAPNLLWLDLLNAYPIDLRELRMRLLRSDNSPLQVRGLTTAVLLIKEENE